MRMMVENMLTPIQGSQTRPIKTRVIGVLVILLTLTAVSLGYYFYGQSPATWPFFFNLGKSQQSESTHSQPLTKEERAKESSLNALPSKPLPEPTPLVELKTSAK